MRIRSGFATLVFIGVLSMAMFSTQAGAYPGFDGGGSIAISPVEGGTLLYGVMVAEYSNVIGTMADARIIVRLRGNGKFYSVYAEAHAVDFSSLQGIQASVENAIKPQILVNFFPGQAGLSVYLSGISEMSTMDALDSVSPLAYQSLLNSWKSMLSAYIAPGQVKQIVPPSLPPQLVTYFIADITVTVK